MVASSLRKRHVCAIIAATFFVWSAVFSSRSLALNRLLLHRHELQPGDISRKQRVVLPLHDKRALHVAKVLQLRDGDTVRVGVFNGGVDDEAQVTWLWPEGSAGKWTDNSPRADRTGRLAIGQMVNALDNEPELPTALQLEFDESTDDALGRPRVDLLLVPPEGEELKQLLPQIAQLGVGTLVLCRSSEAAGGALRDAWIKNEGAMSSLLQEGLAQSGDSWMPEVVVAPRLQEFVFGGELDRIAPPDVTIRLAASKTGQRPWQLPLAGTESRRLLVALGPEGGWSQQEALGLEKAGFQTVSLGKRSLGPVGAVHTALALAHDAVRRWEAG
eukprot:TRINITY_DN101152_c0_g1_i1.p1 TRINITY_DN101152_c0_g1~~TRINITY_DN101152_c0_g1_i1.p1  ORF type:complete len:330 (+),score=41.76 TRINITY_DN101152_c0_g1_i1:63-1052(+)